MVTIMLILTVGILALAIAPWFGSLNTNHGNLNTTDLMAGDEGED